MGKMGEMRKDVHGNSDHYYNPLGMPGAQGEKGLLGGELVVIQGGLGWLCGYEPTARVAGERDRGKGEKN